MTITRDDDEAFVCQLAHRQTASQYRNITLALGESGIAIPYGDENRPFGTVGWDRALLQVRDTDFFYLDRKGCLGLAMALLNCASRMKDE